MLLGQLYHYESQINKLSGKITPENLTQLALFSVDPLPLNKLEGLKFEQKLSFLKDLFVQNYGVLLRENNLKFASNFWNLLTDPKATTKVEIRPNTEFQNALLTWASNGFQEDVASLLSTSSLVVEEEDYLIRYALLVAEMLSPQIAGGDQNNSNLKTDFASDEGLNPEPEILVVCSNNLQPLFVNLNCLYLAPVEDFETLKTQIEQTLASNSSVKLVLIEDYSQDLQRKLQQVLPPDVLVTQLDLDFAEIGFFDALVKSTLGIRLN